MPSEQFKYWCLLLDEIMPVLRDLTRSRRKGDCYTSQQFVEPCHYSLPLEEQTTVAGLPLYYEDCVALEEKFPAIYASFEEGGFVVRHTAKCGSAVPMDQALEKEYNKPAKGQGGIIGFSRRKKQLPNGTSQNMRKQNHKTFAEVCCLTEEDE